MQKVLILEDSERWQDMWQRRFEGKVEILQAFRIAEAKELYATNSDIAVIVVDACVPGDHPTTIPLVIELRQGGFQGPMIASSSSLEYPRDLMSAGCDHSATKDEVPKMVLEILGLQ